jgi:drug/metabolite transporter (DMT)-like permease
MAICMQTRAISRILLLTAALLFSTGGAAIKATSLLSWQVASLRSLVAALALLALVPAARRGWNWRALPVGLAYAGTLVFFVLANKLTTGANAIFLQATAPLYLLLIGPLLLHEPVRRSDLLLIAAVGGGLGLILFSAEPALASAPDPPLGNRFGALSGVTWALTVAGLRWVGRRASTEDGSMATVVTGNLIAFAVALPMALPIEQVAARDVAIVLYLGIFQVGLAYYCVTRGIRHVPAFEASSLLLAEPAANPLWTWLVHGERPGALAVAGGLLILGAALLNAWWQQRAELSHHTGVKQERS